MYEDNENQFDHKYGVRFKPALEKFYIVDSQLIIDGSDIVVKNKKYKGTRGLYELLFKKEPKEFTEEDEKISYEESDELDGLKSQTPCIVKIGQRETNNIDHPANLDSLSNEISNKSIGLSPNIVTLKNAGKFTIWQNGNFIKQYKIINGALISADQDESCRVVPLSNQYESYTCADDPKSRIPENNVVRNLFNSIPSSINSTALIENNLSSSSNPNTNEIMAAMLDDPVINNHSSSSINITALTKNNLPCYKYPYEEEAAKVNSPERTSTHLDPTTSKNQRHSVQITRNIFLIQYLPDPVPSTLQIRSDSEDSCSDDEIPTIKKKKNWIKVKRFTDLCYFCETEVLNFSRHIVRNHSQECEVQRMLSLKPKSLQRRRLIETIRKRGNHLRNLSSCVKPVKKSHVPGRDAADCIPCKHCLGYFRPGQLWRHVKRCPLNPGDKTKYSHKTDAQDLLVKHYAIDQRLKEIVFPTMRPDKVSLVAKQDTLICGYGAQYLTSHREKHHVNVCSRKMRELAKILVELRKLHPTIKNLFDALQPIYFDSFVIATKIVSGYDATNEEYKSSTFDINISTSLKECCSLAIRLVLKKRKINSTVNTAEMEANFNTFQQLLKDSWKFEVSSIAAACLNTKKWNKITIVPLASDLRLFRNYLLKKASQAQQELKLNPNNEKAYKLLLEVVYCRSMLLNRKRGGELQRNNAYRKNFG
ncbi:unnamed protein product [Brassicogethes aeneus]|uniref:DUF8207 domain-containing protein n=1 Tax=Brassicogethes aeneus TaxID=1431903 RepID=A0A9P0BGQ9_BRAAE|nr:unnamed protein product [Brassicogethes aeneus]